MALGKLKETNFKLKIIGNISKKEYAYDSHNYETLLTLDKSDTQLNITFIFENINYTKLLILQN